MPAKLIFNGRVLIALVMFLFFVVMVGIALGYPAQARFMPLVVGLPGIALTLFELFREVRRAARPEVAATADHGASSGLPSDISRLIGQDAALPQGDAPKLSAAEESRRERILLTYFTALIGGILFFGFWITIPAFIATFLREREKAGWAFALSSAIVADVFLYVIFVRVLGVDLHNGFVTEWAMDLVAPGY
ncbi:MAG: tripartite tricarboxylate transporter TctB family protein [Gemmatimonas sp.]